MTILENSATALMYCSKCSEDKGFSNLVHTYCTVLFL